MSRPARTSRALPGDLVTESDENECRGESPGLKTYFAGVKKRNEGAVGEAAGDGGLYSMERAVSLAVVKADHAPVIQAVLDGVNVAAAAAAVVNPAAGLIVQTAAATGGWVWNKWKYDRVSPVLVEITKRVQGIENDYVRREEFADLLWDALPRQGPQGPGKAR